MTTPERCKICRHPNRRRLIEADWADGVSAVGIAKTMTDSGWPLTGPTVLAHLKEHAGPGAATRQPPTLAKRDAAVYFRDRIMDEIERRDAAAAEAAAKGEGAEADRLRVNILDKDLQPALKTALGAEAIITKRESEKKPRTGLLMLMLGVAEGQDNRFAPKRLTSGEVGEVEGEVIELVDDEDDLA